MPAIATPLIDLFVGRRNQRGRAVNGILLLDKPAACTSNQALQRIKRLYDARKAGHTGSLDPLATGMLPLCFGEATKISGFLLDADKEYLAGARLGSTTDTADADGAVLTRQPLPARLDLSMIDSAARKFTGAIEQIPPMYSAIKIDGQRLYKLAREGVSVERTPRRVTVFSIRVLHFKDDLVLLKVRCSKGTYIRTLVEDIGVALGCGAHVDSLRRLSVTPFAESSMITEKTLQALSAEGAAALDDLLLPLDEALKHLPQTELEQHLGVLFRHGQSVRAASASADDNVSGAQTMHRVYCNNEFLGIGKMVGDLLKPRRLFNA